MARRIGKPLVIDEAVADELARLRVALRAIGRAMKVMDAWIAATAMASDAAVCTQDADFEAAREAGLLTVVRGSWFEPALSARLRRARARRTPGITSPRCPTPEDAPVSDTPSRNRHGPGDENRPAEPFATYRGASYVMKCSAIRHLVSDTGVMLSHPTPCVRHRGQVLEGVTAGLRRQPARLIGKSELQD